MNATTPTHTTNRPVVEFLRSKKEATVTTPAPTHPARIPTASGHVGSTEAVTNIMKANPGKFYTTKTLSEATGFTKTQISSVFQHLRRMNSPIVAGERGQYAWASDAAVKQETTTTVNVQEFRRAVVLYEALLRAAQTERGGNPTYEGSYVNALGRTDRNSFRTNRKFSASAVKATYKLLKAGGCVRNEGPVRKVMVAHPNTVWPGIAASLAPTIQTEEFAIEPEQEVKPEVKSTVQGRWVTWEVNAEKIGTTTTGDTLYRTSDGDLVTIDVNVTVTPI